MLYQVNIRDKFYIFYIDKKDNNVLKI